jgi:multidrug resistance efflux pump
MNAPRRPRRFFWLVGLLLLVGTVAGVGWALNHAPAGTPSPREGTRESEPPGLKWVTFIGYVDVKRGLTPLYPLQPGRVTEVFVAEGDKVVPGQKLFRIDDTLAKAQLKEALAALAAAQAGLAQVKRSQASQKDQVEQQKAGVEVARRNAKALTYAVARAKKLFDLKPPQLSVEEYRVAQEKAGAAEAQVELEKIKLRTLEAYDFTPDLEQAQQTIKAKQAAVEQAQKVLEECIVTAPEPGMILRLHVTQGQVLGREPTQPAIQFCPQERRIIRTEIQQEWGNAVEPGQIAIIEDDTRYGHQWKGTVTYVSDWYAPRRAKVHEPFQYNDVRTLECIITPEGNPPLRIHQRMRVRIKRDGK